MANTVEARGFDPEWAQGPTPECLSFNVLSTNAALFKNSPFWKASTNVIDAVVTGHTNAATNGITGSVCIIYDSTGFPVHNLGASATAGAKIEGSHDPAQKYRLASSDKVTTAMMVQYGDFTAEAATAGTGSYGTPGGTKGSDWSSRKFDTTTATATAANGQIKVVSISPQFLGNDLNITGSINEIWVIINPLFYVG